MVSSVLHSSNKDDWQTPDDVWALVDEMAHPKPVWDPCPTGGKNGMESWEPYRDHLVYMNPPYGRTVGRWVGHAELQWLNFGVETIALLPARPDTKWMHSAWDFVSGVCWWKGRIRFVGAEHGAPFPSVFLYWGTRTAKFCKVFQKRGRVEVYE